MPVYFTRNLWVAAGIANGTCGTLIGMCFKDSFQPSPVSAAAVTAAIVRIDPPYHGPSIVPGDRLVAIPTCTDTMKCCNRNKRTVTAIRKQIPLKPNLARTVHKAQGLTVPSVHVHLEGAIAKPALAFVALSRTKRLQDITLHPCDATRLMQPTTPGSKAWQSAFLRLMANLDRATHKFLRNFPPSSAAE